MNRLEKSVVFVVLVVLVAMAIGFLLGGGRDGSVLMSPHMMGLSWVWFPVVGGFMLFGLALGVLLLAFWAWMLVDCAQRHFRNDVEKVIWLLVIVFGGWFGALVYLIVIRSINRQGLIRT